MLPPWPFWSLSTKRRRLKLVVAYDGSDFCGFAPQRGERTVHGTLTDAIRRISGEEIEITGASRTDSGANALGQVVHFDTESAIPDERWRMILNRVLPADVAVQSVAKVHPDFHARFWAVDRRYRYRILAERSPIMARMTHQVEAMPEVGPMQEAAHHLEGEHDFLAFSQQIERGMSTVRTLYSIGVSQAGKETRIDIIGSAFVRGMMRRISGALLEIGLGRRGPDYIPELLSAKRRDRIDWPPVLPACGLTLMEVRYGRHPQEQRRLNAADIEQRTEE